MEVTSARCYQRPPDLDALLARPHGYVAWVLRPGDREEESEQTLHSALERWFGAPEGAKTHHAKAPKRFTIILILRVCLKATDDVRVHSMRHVPFE